jgi:hypothetical protein
MHKDNAGHAVQLPTRIDVYESGTLSQEHCGSPGAIDMTVELQSRRLAILLLRLGCVFLCRLSQDRIREFDAE